MYRAPASCAAFTHCSASSASGLNTDGFAVPSPHSSPRNVFVPKCTSTPSSRSCHRTCCGLGSTSAKLGGIAAAGVAAAMPPTNRAQMALNIPADTPLELVSHVEESGHTGINDV